jgi:hypothetical protein
MKDIEFKLKNNTEVKMGFEEFVRWACLVEGIDFISKALDEQNAKKDDDSWIKPLAIQKYIDERFHAMKHDMTVEIMMGAK